MAKELIKSIPLSWISAIILVAVVSGITGYEIGKSKNCGGFIKLLERIFKNIENYVIVMSVIVLITSLVYSGSTGDSALLSAVLNVFATVIFSWLLTKKSAMSDFKSKEEELALKSYRHINYIESAANTASGTIDKYASEHSGIDAETKLILSSAKEQIKYIQGGIKTCKMDWFDLLSREEQEKKSRSESFTDDYGTVDRVIPNEELNQEDV